MNRNVEGPRLLCPPPVRSPVSGGTLTLHLASHQLSLGPHVKSCSSTWVLQEGLGVPVGWPDKSGPSNYKALQVHLQGLSLALSWAVMPLCSQSPTEPGSEQRIIKYLMRWTNN